jgi:hypothetical protein
VEAAASTRSRSTRRARIRSRWSRRPSSCYRSRCASSACHRRPKAAAKARRLLRRLVLLRRLLRRLLLRRLRCCRRCGRAGRSKRRAAAPKRDGVAACVRVGGTPPRQGLANGARRQRRRGLELGRRCARVSRRARQRSLARGARCSPCAMSSSPSSSRNVVQSLYEAFSRNDGEAMAACYRPDTTFCDGAFGELKGRALATCGACSRLAAATPRW